MDTSETVGQADGLEVCAVVKCNLPNFSDPVGYVKRREVRVIAECTSVDERYAIVVCNVFVHHRAVMTPVHASTWCGGTDIQTRRDWF